MKIRKTWGAVLGASALLALAACGGSSDSSTETEEAATEDSAEVTAGEDITIAVITHGDDGVFWSPLLYFRCVAVRCHAVSTHAIRYFTIDIGLFCASSCTRHTRFRINNDIAVLNDCSPQKRNEWQLRRGWITAGVCNQTSIFYCITRQFSKPIDSIFL